MSNQEAFDKIAAMRNHGKPLSETIAANAKALSDLGRLTEGIYPKSDREVITEFLIRIGIDADDREFEMQCCATDPGARRYWLCRARGIEPEVELVEAM